MFHIGFFKQTLAVLSCTCKACSRVLLDETEAVKYLRKFRRWAQSGAPIYMTSRPLAVAWTPVPALDMQPRCLAFRAHTIHDALSVVRHGLTLHG